MGSVNVNLGNHHNHNRNRNTTDDSPAASTSTSTTSTSTPTSTSASTKGVRTTTTTRPATSATSKLQLHNRPGPLSRNTTQQSSASGLSATTPTTSTLKRLPTTELPPLNSNGARKPTIITRTNAKPKQSNRTAQSTTNSTVAARTIVATATATTTATPTATATASRTALNSKDQNAAPVTGPLLKPVQVAGNMPYETPSNSNNPKNRPQMPSLSAKVMNRTPFTPKIASKSPQTQTHPQSHPYPHPQTPTIATTTPANRRSQRPTTANSNRDTTTANTNTNTNTHRLSQHDEPPSSVTPFLSNNITPRSGSRQSRVDSANSTPSGTPNPDRSEGWDPRASSGLPSPRLEGDAMRRPVVTFSPMNLEPNPHGQGRQDAQHGAESKFFHASDAKTAHPRPTSASRPPPVKGPTFFYANGNTVESKPTSPTTSTPAHGHATTQESLSSKFMYANGAPELRPSPPALASRASGSGSTLSTASKTPTSRPPTNPPTSGHALGQRPVSPIKLPSHTPQPLQVPSKSTHPPPSGTTRARVVSPSQLGPSPPGLGPRRSSTATSRSGGHSRSGSLVKGEQGAGTAKLLPSHMSSEPTSPVSTVSRPAPLTLASIIQAADEFEGEDAATSPDDARSGVQSPTKSTHSAEPVNELVANARRERKVQDLQITNASLEAINRTLERQLRKQTAELRRYKRLSRAGRLSLASTTISSRSPSETLSEQQAAGLGLSDLSEEGSDMDSEPEEESFSDTDSASESQSSTAVAEKDAKYRKKDENRLQLDLSKHQDLLIDSQKINQSIKKCLDWTEELIKDGKKALEYHVRVSDVAIGGRVLDPLDDEDEGPTTAGSTPDDTIRFTDKLVEEVDRIANWSAAAQDRDSGVELPADGG